MYSIKLFLMINFIYNFEKLLIMKIYLPIIFISLLVFSCTSSRVVKPLEDGDKEVGLSLGGPLINFSDVVIPIPLTSVHYARGLSNSFTTYGSLHTTSLISGVIHTEMGVLYNFLDENEYYFGLSASTGFNFMVDIWEWNPKMFPVLDINAYKTYNDKGSFYYFGISNWFDLARYKAHGEINTNKWLFAPHIGHTYVGEKWNINVEIKYLAPHVSNEDIVVDYVKWFGSRGAPGIYLGFNYRF